MIRIKMIARFLRLSLVGTALFLMAGSLFAQTDASDRYGLQGVFHLNDSWRFCIVDKQTKEGTWVGLGETVGGFHVVSFDVETRWMTFTAKGETLGLRVAEMGAPTGGPANPTAPLAMPTAKGIPFPDNNYAPVPLTRPTSPPPNYTPVLSPEILKAQAEANASGMPFSTSLISELLSGNANNGGTDGMNAGLAQALAESGSALAESEGGGDPPERPDFTPVLPSNLQGTVPQLTPEAAANLARWQAEQDAIEAAEGNQNPDG